MTAPTDRWPLFLTNPAKPPEAPGWWDHLWAALFAVVVPVAFGMVLLFAAWLAELAVGPEWAGATTLGVFGLIFVVTIAFSWIGFIPGILASIGLLQLGAAGWGTYLLMGFFIGAVTAPLLGTQAPIFLGPPYAILYAFWLRRMAPAAFLPR